MEGGLRERKKARTRLAISDVATALFAEHGFEAVTVAQIAAAADVSVKTIFNYFATKEDLFFDRADEIFAALVAAIRNRPPGATVLGALHELLAEHRVPFARDGWASLRDPEGYERYRAFVATEHASPALRARRLVLTADWARRLAPVLAEELGLEPDGPPARTLAAMLMTAIGLREPVLAAGMLERAAPAEIERRVRAAVDEAFGRLAAAFADADRPAPAACPLSPASPRPPSDARAPAAASGD
ncbi:MAG: TetR/AcrR family transcriptional regulator [Actinomycetota bacterium]|nr:TetR/AcrR family transcriptional regulator [Actinomycetota bacterium]